MPRPAAEVGIAAHHHHLVDPERKGDLDRLRQHRPPLRQCPLALVGDVLAAIEHLALPRAEEPRQNLYQGRLAGAVRTEDQVQPPGLEPRRDAVQDRMAAGRVDQAARLDPLRTHIFRAVIMTGRPARPRAR